MRIVKKIWSYFGKTQPVWVRVLHLTTIVLVLSQFLTSNLIEIGSSAGAPVFFLGAWTHILPGLILFGVTFVFALTEFLRRGLKFFFPYLWGDFSQLVSDLKTLLGRRLPEAAPGGLAAIVQGLGLGAMGLTVLSGGLWFFLTRAGSGMADTAILIHEGVTGLVLAYIVGHGGMGLIHMILWFRTGEREDSAT